MRQLEQEAHIQIRPNALGVGYARIYAEHGLKFSGVEPGPFISKSQQSFSDVLVAISTGGWIIRLFRIDSACEPGQLRTV